MKAKFEGTALGYVEAFREFGRDQIVNAVTGFLGLAGAHGGDRPKVAFIESLGNSPARL